jgi:hypothetical protein
MGLQVLHDVPGNLVDFVATHLIAHLPKHQGQDCDERSDHGPKRIRVLRENPLADNTAERGRFAFNGRCQVLRSGTVTYGVLQQVE